MTDEEFDYAFDTKPGYRIIEMLLERYAKMIPGPYNKKKIVYHLERALKATEVKEPEFK